jgi:hypothetical protein
VESVEFVLLQQRPGGAFGYFGPELCPLDARSLAEVDLVRDLQLPATVACLWTVAEISRPRWRLYSSLRALAPRDGLA